MTQWISNCGNYGRSRSKLELFSTWNKKVFGCPLVDALAGTRNSMAGAPPSTFS